MKSWESKGWRLVCPICRHPIVKERVTKKLMVMDEVPEGEVNEIFEMDKGAGDENQEEIKEQHSIDIVDEIR